LYSVEVRYIQTNSLDKKALLNGKETIKNSVVNDGNGLVLELRKWFGTRVKEMVWY
jgi:hypothetical protein